MTGLGKQRLDTLFSAFQEKTILVVGDVMLDSYLWGRVSRISPEAPVPVVDIQKESHCLGGAANVAFNIASLGAAAIPVGIIGDDPQGRVLAALFSEQGFADGGLITAPGRPTTVKTRIIAHNQQVVRTDRESTDAIPATAVSQVIDTVRHFLNEADAVVIEDYNKGMLTPDLIGGIIGMAAEAAVPVLVDPKFDNFFRYRGVTLFKPNRKEAADRLGMKLETRRDADLAGKRLLDELACGAVLITLGEEGMSLYEAGKQPVHIPTRAQTVHDVSGAGDTVIAVMSLAISAGATFREAAVIANQAAGIVCEEVGIVPVNRESLYSTLLQSHKTDQGDV
ncbi:D-glycero-beta-D-manno-heptose-7-phosphate kinase [bacterium]|nr:D-glycero-beta-D-manno-heptose-7-phosphate kinase [bacterium]